MNIVRTAAATAALLVVLGASGAVAQEAVVDQSFYTSGNLGGNINECCSSIGQIVTAGMTGTLVGVNVDVHGFSTATGTLVVSIYSVENGLPAQPLASTPVPSSSSLFSSYVAFAPGVPVTAGMQFAIVVTSVGGPPPGGGQGQAIWTGATGDLYPGADMVYLYGSSWYSYYPYGYDLFFQTWVVPPGVDADGDGFAANLDCNDADPTVHPGAQEIAHDGIDQDCNGYDLTIDVLKANYDPVLAELHVVATSSLGAAAKLAAEGYGPLTYKANRNEWVLSAPVAAAPATVTVSGIEGAITTVVR